MKKILIALAILAIPALTFGAVTQIDWYNYFASISTQSGQNIFIYKVIDEDTTCYVLTNDYSLNSRSNGDNFGISCVK